MKFAILVKLVSVWSTFDPNTECIVFSSLNALSMLAALLVSELVNGRVVKVGFIHIFASFCWHFNLICGGLIIFGATLCSELLTSFMRDFKIAHGCKELIV